MPGRVLDFEVNYDEIETERRQVTHWKKSSSGREVRNKLRRIVVRKGKQNLISLKKFYIFCIIFNCRK
jgi:hypothetical protein